MEELLLQQAPYWFLSPRLLTFLVLEPRGADNDTGGYADYPCGLNGGSPYYNGQSTTGFRLSTTTSTAIINWFACGYTDI